MKAVHRKIDELNREAYSRIYTDIASAHAMLEEARELLDGTNYTVGIAWSLLISGLLEMEQGNLDQSAGKIDQAYHIFIDLNSDLSGICAALNGKGLICIRQSRVRESFNYLQKALGLARENNFKDMEYRAVNLLGILQFQMENYSQALRFFKKALKLITREKQSSILNNLGCTYRALGKFDQALEHLNKALGETEKNGSNDIQIPILEEIGLTYGKMGNSEKGIEILNLALEKCTDYHKRFKLSIKIKLGDLYIKKEEYDKAEQVLNEARDLINYANSIQNRDLYLYLSGLNEIKENYRSALIHYKNYHMLSGKIKSSETDEKIWEMETESFREMNRRIRKISEMGRLLTALLDRDQVIKTLFHSVQSIFEVDCFVIGLYMSGEELLPLDCYNSRGEKISSSILPVIQPRNPETWVAIHRTGLIFNEISEDYIPYFPVMETIVPLPDMSSVLCLPFDSGNEKGLISIYREKTGAFNREDYEILEMLTSYASIALSNARQTEISREKNRELEKLNKYDDLTGIYNRRHLQKKLEKSWNLCRRAGNYLHILLIDLDYFKNINDSFGHAAGDECLKILGQLYKSILQRSSDIYGRYGGEEFLVILQDMPIDEAEEMTEKIRHAIENEKVVWRGEQIKLTVSIGLCSARLSDTHSVETEAIIGQADRNMYISKSKGRNRITCSEL
ncbi:tetratricopeptide repeat-containing diguanylate cyclase [Spirochaeta isovalerica]|uniref:diguanylate cyclase n=1 Tax=Spirochaeta isovalerica TaxID=150 RepID=A0A841RFJ1_9SPIO|nr:diguanylate cyclase [Spirochaeta isovalerica]MBB6481579.1 diguanylate cyclase (GGDEF)-like protein [Spirochaeta isovalerica]